MEKPNIDLLGISEIWWPDCRDFISRNSKVFFSGNQNKNRRNSVSIIVKENIALNVNINQLYAPTVNKSDNKIETLYEELHELMRLTKQYKINAIQGDFNAKVEKEKV